MNHCLHFIFVTASVLVLCLSTPIYYVSPSNWPAYGEYPSYLEREMGTWLNVVRVAPIWYRDKIIAPHISDSSLSDVFASSTLKSVEPGFWNYNIHNAARGHCIDVVQHKDYLDNYGGHNDANGTEFSERLSRFHDWSSCGEIYMNWVPGDGLYRGYMAVQAWVCDGPTTIGGGITDSHSCPVDSSAGHRKIIMKKCLQFGCGADGVGSDAHSKWDTYTATCDCDNVATTTYAGKHIASATHLGDPNRKGNFMYLAVIQTKGITVSSVRVIESDSSSSRTITLGLNQTGTNGAVYGSASYAPYTSCRSYFFEVKYGSTTERYPETGYLYTYGMSCTTNWNSRGLCNDCSDEGSSVSYHQSSEKGQSSEKSQSSEKVQSSEEEPVIESSSGDGKTVVIVVAVAASVVGVALVAGVVVLALMFAKKNKNSNTDTDNRSVAMEPATPSLSSTSMAGKPASSRPAPPAPARSHPSPSSRPAPPPPAPSRSHPSPSSRPAPPPPAPARSHPSPSSRPAPPPPARNGPPPTPARARPPPATPPRNGPAPPHRGPRPSYL